MTRMKMKKPVINLDYGIQREFQKRFLAKSRQLGLNRIYAYPGIMPVDKTETLPAIIHMQLRANFDGIIHEGYDVPLCEPLRLIVDGVEKSLLEEG